MVQIERIKKDLGNAILYISDNQTARIVFNEYVSAQVKGYKTLEKMKKGYFLGGNQQEDYGYGSDFQYDKEADGHIFFTPEWGESKSITNIEDFLKHVAKKRKIDRGYFWCRWLKKSDWNFGDIEEVSKEKLLKERPSPDIFQKYNLQDKHSYLQLKDGELKEIYEKDLPIKGNLNGKEDDLTHAYAITAGKKEWEWCDKKWTEDSWHRYRQPQDFEEEEQEY